MTAQLCYEDVETGSAITPLTVTVSETQMFFFSAATYNGHRIHYDKDFARNVEGYDNVLVHGPLQAALLSRALTDWIGDHGHVVDPAQWRSASNEIGGRPAESIGTML